jgi:AraC-like DNA-binding protein
MKHPVIKFPQPDDQDFNSFANEFGAQPEGDNVIQLSGKIARGTVKRMHLETDFDVCTWDVLFHCPVEVRKEATAVEGAVNSYTIMYVLTPESVTIKNIGSHAQYNKLQNKSTVLLSNDVRIDYQLQPNQPVRLLCFNVTETWVRQQLQLAGIFADQLTQEIADKPMIIVDQCASGAGQAACRLFNAIMQPAEAPANLQTPAVLLVAEFIERVFSKNNSKTTSRDIYYDKIMEAEAILLAHLQTNLPTLEKIAKQVALSESTLKRHFKAIFGRNIYEYYLEQKMNLAKNMLLEKPLSVNEAAEILGYEKVSNFIDIFKKHHGFSPGRMKKRMEFSKIQ